MFYFSHPLNSGVASSPVGASESYGNYNSSTEPAPSTTTTTSRTTNQTTSTTMPSSSSKDVDDVNETDRIRLASFVPWARETWSRENSAIAPLAELVAKRNGKRLDSSLMNIVLISISGRIDLCAMRRELFILLLRGLCFLLCGLCNCV